MMRARQSTGTQSGQAGFSLVEALVALTIIAALAAALADTLTAHARMRGAVTDRRLALMVAQSALARIEAGDPADGGHIDGGAAGVLAWHAVREPYEDSGGNAGAEAGTGFAVAAPLEQISVTVDDAAQHRLITLRTVRVRS